MVRLQEPALAVLAVPATGARIVSEPLAWDVVDEVPAIDMPANAPVPVDALEAVPASFMVSTSEPEPVEVLEAVPARV
jgi:hypothetical protein